MVQSSILVQSKKRLFVILSFSLFHFCANANMNTNVKDIDNIKVGNIKILARGGSGSHGGGERSESPNQINREVNRDVNKDVNRDLNNDANWQNNGVLVPYGSPTVIETTDTPTATPSPTDSSTSETQNAGTNSGTNSGINVIPNSPASAIAAPNNSGSNNPAAAAQQRANQDLEITRNIQVQIMANTNVPIKGIVVDTIDGVVMLSGTVDTTAQKQSIEDYAKALDGVKRVDSSITVKNPGATPGAAVK